MASKAFRRLTAWGIIVALAGCDNVEWGGAEVRLQPPPPVERAPEDTTVAADPEAAPLPPLPEGPILFLGSRSGARVTLRPVAELRGDTLLPLLLEEENEGFLEHLAATRLGPGSEFTLLAGGARVGTLVADEYAVTSEPCRASLAVSGLAELTQAASSHTRFLALERARTPTAATAHGGYVPDQPGSLEGDASLNLASRVIMREEAYWPDNLTAARAELHRIPLAEGEGTGVAATFLFRDRLAVEPSASPAVAYSLFVLGRSSEAGHALEWDWYREVEQDGKGAPRYFESADWDGDGSPEILLELLGVDTRWVVALDRRGERWERVFEESCVAGTPGAP